MMVEAMHDKGLDLVWCETFDGAIQASAEINAVVCVADYNLGFGESRTGLDFLTTFVGEGVRRILFTGLPPNDVPDGIEVFTKRNLTKLLEALSEVT